jgi:hypothetical protein
METHDAATLLETLIGLEPALAHLLTIAQQLQQSRNPRLVSFANTMHRHVRGEQVSVAAVKQELQHSMR